MILDIHITPPTSLNCCEDWHWSLLRWDGIGWTNTGVCGSDKDPINAFSKALEAYKQEMGIEVKVPAGISNNRDNINDRKIS